MLVNLFGIVILDDNILGLSWTIDITDNFESMMTMDFKWDLPNLMTRLSCWMIVSAVFDRRVSNTLFLFIETC